VTVSWPRRLPFIEAQGPYERLRAAGEAGRPRKRASVAGQSTAWAARQARRRIGTINVIEAPPHCRVRSYPARRARRPVGQGATRWVSPSRQSQPPADGKGWETYTSSADLEPSIRSLGSRMASLVAVNTRIEIAVVVQVEQGDAGMREFIAEEGTRPRSTV